MREKMAKVKSKWICQECGYETAGYLGKCPECGSWGSLVEEVQFDSKLPNAAANEFVNTEKPALLKDIHIGEEVRISTNISEFDRILGGGFVQGSLILLAGDPGIGKSTITLQTCGQLCKSGKKVLYISAEESASQLKLRAERLNINSDNLYIYPQTNMENIKSQNPGYIFKQCGKFGRKCFPDKRMHKYFDAYCKKQKYYNHCNRTCNKRREYSRAKSS